MSENTCDKVNNHLIRRGCYCTACIFLHDKQINNHDCRILMAGIDTYSLGNHIKLGPALLKWCDAVASLFAFRQSCFTVDIREWLQTVLVIVIRTCGEYIEKHQSSGGSSCSVPPNGVYRLWIRHSKRISVPMPWFPETQRCLAQAEGGRGSHWKTR